jgi:hypothetical protein
MEGVSLENSYFFEELEPEYMRFKAITTQSKYG